MIRSAWVISLVLLLVAPESAAQPEREVEHLASPKPEERICLNQETTLDAMKCMDSYLRAAKQSLENALSLLIGAWEPDENTFPEDIIKDKEDLQNFQDAQKSWEIYVEAMCNKFMINYWLPGTLYKTETIKCKYLLYRERERFLRSAFYRAFDYLESE